MKKNHFMPVLILLLILLASGSGFLESLFDGKAEVTYDPYMETLDYQVDVTVEEDSSYRIEEEIRVDFKEPRHGIYRYIPQKGVSVTRKENGEPEKEPYYARIEVLETSAEAEVSSESGNTVIRLGSEDEFIYGKETYRLVYRVTPFLQNDSYSNVYYNIFPILWQNPLPLGSRFSITFPKEFSEEALAFYYGEYGSSLDAREILDLSREGLTVTGVLRESLELGEGLTCYAAMEPGYFDRIHTVNGAGTALLVLSLAVLAVVAVLFLALGKDPAMYPSIQYQPPDDLDSAAVGYIIDSAVENRDVLSLIIYWADSGCLTIQEEKGGSMRLRKIRELPESAPRYQHTMFDRLFRNGTEVSTEDLQYKFTDTINSVKEQIRNRYSGRKRGIYTRSSQAARVVSTFLCAVPFAAFTAAISILCPLSGLRAVLHVFSVAGLLVGVCLFNHTIDRWYSNKQSSRSSLLAAGLCVCAVSLALFSGSYLVRAAEGEAFSFLPAYAVMLASTVVMIFLTGFMKKRTGQCVEWMGRLAGLRDFIETAELERLQAMAEENPQWFYHILPYTYVFGLSDVFARKLENLAIPGPEWYQPLDTGGSFWDYYLFHHLFMRNMHYASRVMTQAEPPKIENSGSYTGGSGFGGGSFGGGGGFSGGGFGGGGGGSW